MALDSMPIATLAAELIDELEEEYGTAAHLVGFAVVVELLDDEDDSIIHVRSPEGTPRSEQAGRLARGLSVVVDPD